MDRLTVEELLGHSNPASIFRTFACVGDSLSSGEVVALSPANGGKIYNDYYEYSWGQFIAREIGSIVRNFSRGGMTASEYIQTFADRQRMWNPDLAAQAYLIALGVNDLFGKKQELGSVADVNLDDPSQNKPTFAGYYAQIIQRYRKIQPRAMFFLITLPHYTKYDDTNPGMLEAHRALLYDLAKLFPNTYVIDLYRDAPVYDEKYRELYMMNGHMTPLGYMLSAKTILTLWNRIILDNLKDFDDVAFIGTNMYSK